MRMCNWDISPDFGKINAAHQRRQYNPSTSCIPSAGANQIRFKMVGIQSIPSQPLCGSHMQYTILKLFYLNNLKMSRLYII